MKNLFSKPEIEICKLTCNDVVCTSNGIPDDLNGDGTGNGGDGGNE